MPWPSPQDYNEAVQTPLVSFLDAALKSGTAELTAYGLPRPISGAFASVYRFLCQDNQWAVRCFLQRVDGQEDRYRLLSDYLKQQHPLCMVPFEFLRQGVLVHGSWYPILKMEWVEGETLSAFVDRNRADAQLMLALAGTFENICSELAKNGIAHGDLQHGNIMICGDRIKLVDYDGMYTPPLQGMQSNELGHRNYQHPARQKHHFGPYLDNFSAWVISGSLRALADDPSLWETLRGGDECLLFRQSDYQQPLESLAFSSFEHHQNKEVALIGRTIRSFLELPVERVPPLGSHVDLPDMPDTPSVVDVTSLLSKRSQARSNTTSSWLSDWAAADGATKLDIKLVVDTQLVESLPPPPNAQLSAPAGQRQSEAMRNLIEHQFDPNNYSNTAATANNLLQTRDPFAPIAAFLSAAGLFFISVLCVTVMNHSAPQQQHYTPPVASPPIDTDTNYLDTDPNYLNGLTLMSQNNFEGAICDFDAAIKRNPKLEPAWVKKAESERKTGKFQDALADAQEAVRLAPKDPDAYYNKGMAEASLNEVAEAKSDLASAIFVKPNGYPGAYYALGTLEVQNNEPQKGIAHLSEFTKMQPKDVYGWLELARAYSHSNNYQQALAALNHASVIGVPDSMRTKFYLARGNVYEHTRQFDNALADYNAYINLVPGDATGYVRRGFVYAQLKSWHQAVANYTIAINTGDAPSAYYNRALAYYQLKDFDKALADIQEYRELEPNDANAEILKRQIMAGKPN